MISTLMVLAAAGSSQAKTHPVPLEPGTDAAKCASCHEDKTKGKAVHSAIASGCLSCHEVRINKDVTRIKLTTATPIKLCLQCHADKDAGQIKGHVHNPAVRDCLKCHDPHVSDFKNQLLKATDAPGKDSNLCLQCHDTGVNVAKTGSRHAALDSGCETCHVTHKTGASADAEFRYHLTKASPAICTECHDPKDAQIAKAHQAQPIEKADCLTCHDPHQSSAPKLMRAFQHSPFESKACDTCHQPARDGKVVLTAASTKELCVTCHDEQAKQIQNAKVQHPGAQGDCTDCHSPHAGKAPGLLRPDGVNACLPCHADQAELAKKGHVHQPAFAQACSTCHEPHGGENAKLLRTAKVNQLCLECHGPDSEPKRLEKEHLTAIFDGKVRLPEDYFRNISVLPLKYGIGHPTGRHPVSDVTNIQTKSITPMNCLSCHQPHASAKPDLLAKDQANNMDFCRTCHTNGLNLTDVRSGGK
ncbi:MAG TPA: cytochrome c3 family protein [Bryobacteraceae bacterium]|nr:cytochrome c3 family protein [Bryobacteraceae bacterium]